ncbi:IS66 family insertion sequence element accessory protein TnpB, partial [Thiolapillus sp.]|uniref:IS66 family insertion sequence element accessory protein TnpB n=1 Tax=Thiolapillus sp. TaxID=2017437 RepID=UPI003AF7437F
MDFRKSFRGLAAIVEQELGHNPFEGALYAFTNRRRDKIKLKRVFDLVIDFGTSQSPKSTRPLTTYLCPSRPGHQALRNNFASSLLLRTWLPMTGRRVRRPTLFSLWRKARRENSAASRLLGSTSLRFALHGWQRLYWEDNGFVLYYKSLAEEKFHWPGGEEELVSLTGQQINWL